MKSKRLIHLCVSLLSTLALVFVSFGPAQPAEATAAEQGKYGGILKIIMRKSPINFGNPTRIIGSDMNYAIPFLERLLSVGEGGVYLPELATSWQTAPDGKSITFNLRQGVVFHDGTEFNAKAVKFNYDRIIPTGYLSGVTSLDVVDDYTVRINLSTPNNLILYSLASMSACHIISPTAFQKHGEDWADTHPIGTGPFILQTYDRNAGLTCTRNPDYWDKGLPYLDGMEIMVVPDAMSAMTFFKAGGAHEYYDCSFETGAELRDAGYSVFIAPAGIEGYIFETSPGSVFTNPKVRQAIEYAINKEDICYGPGLNFFTPMYQLSIDASPYYNKNLIPRKYDPDKAKQLLAEAGLGNGFTFKYNAPHDQWRDAIAAEQSNLAQVGIIMDINFVSSAINTQIKKGKLGAGEASHMKFQIYPNTLHTIDLYLRSDSAQYGFMVRPAGIDELINQAKLAQNEDSKAKIIQQIAKLVYDDEPFVPLWTSPRIVVVGESVQDHGWFINGDSNNTKYGRSTWLKK